MGDAAGELADGFDLLRLAQGFFDLSAFVHLRVQFLVGLFQLAGALDYQRFELIRGALTGFEQVPDFVLAMPPAQGGFHRAGQGDALYRAFQQGNVAQRRHHALTPCGDCRLLMLAGKDHEWKVGPRRLLIDPCGQCLEVLTEEAFFGDENGVGIGFGAT